jgi:hypothetical protein
MLTVVNLPISFSFLFANVILGNSVARCILFTDYDGTTYEVETPLSSKVSYETVRKHLEIPDYVDKSSFTMERGLVTVWAGLNAHRVKELFPEATLQKPVKEPIPTLFFGGAAVRMLSPSANKPSSPFFRELNDIDLIALKNRAQDLYKLLLSLGEICGTRYYHFAARSDCRFNAMRAGKRYRVRTIEKILEDGSLQCGVLDIFTDAVDLRHKVDVREEFSFPKENLYTIGVENVILSKCQFIFDVPLSARDELIRQHMDYRILSYPHYRSDRLLIGIEEKDMKDICALFFDHEIGNEKNNINPEKMRKILEKDKKFALTFRLNLENILRNEAVLQEIGFSKADITKFFSRIQKVLEIVPKVEKKWSNPWWNVDVETPQIFGKA